LSTEDFASFIQHQEDFPPLLGLAALIGGIIVPFVYYSYYWVRYTRDNCPRCGRQIYTQLVGNAKVGSFWSFSRHTNREGDDRYYICHACRWYFLIEGVNDLG
jgi:hypothetical protein